MKKFEEILGFTQEELKTYLGNYLRGSGYKVEVGDGYVFAKGDVPVLLIAHMDTARNKEIPHTIIKEPTLDGIRMTADSTLIGGDDRCGCWMIMNIVKKAKCHVLFLEDEEIGCVGARKFTLSKENIAYVKSNIKFMIELDRRGSNDCVFYRNDNKKFKSYIEEKTGTKEAEGSCSDISTLMPVTGLAGVNISCGYYKEHTTDEYIMIDEMNDVMARVTEFLTSEEEFPKFEYEEKKWDFGGFYSGWGKGWDNRINNRRRYSALQSQAFSSIETLTLNVVLDEDFDGIELSAEGTNQAEAWANFFIENGDVSFNMIEDFYWS